jgi:hypothetical protein
VAVHVSTGSHRCLPCLVLIAPPYFVICRGIL